MTDTGYLPNLLGPVRITVDGGDPMPARATWNLVGATVADDPTFDRTVITVTGGGGSVPSGTGLRKVVAGAEAPAAALLVNADVAANAAIALTKLAIGTAAQIIVADAEGTWRPQSASGDATIAVTGAITVAKVNGASVPASAGALVTGTILRATGADSLAYGALDLANAAAVTGTLPTARQAAQSLGGVLGGTTAAAAFASGAFGAVPLQTSDSLTLGAGGAGSASSGLIRTAANPGVVLSSMIGAVTTSVLDLQGGSYIVVGGATWPYLQMQAIHSGLFGANVNDFVSVTAGDVGISTAGTSAPIRFCNNANTALTISPNSGGVTSLSASAPVTSFLITQASNTTDVACHDITVSPQAPYASATGTNRDPGSFIVNLPASAGGSLTKIGGIEVRSNGTPVAAIGTYYDGTYQGIWLGSAAITGSNASILQHSGAQSYNTSTVHYFQYGTNTKQTLTSTYATFGNTAVGAMQIDQIAATALRFVALASGMTSASIIVDSLSANGATGIAFSVRGQSMTGTTSIGGALQVGGGTGTTSYGMTQIVSPLDPGTLPYTFAADSNQTLTPAQSANNVIDIAAGVISAGRTLTLSRAAANPGFVLVVNRTAYTIAVGWLTGSMVNVATGTSAWIGSNGTNAIVRMSGGI